MLNDYRTTDLLSHNETNGLGERIAAMLVHIYAQTGEDPRSAASQLVDCTKKVVSELTQKLRSFFVH